MQIEPGAFHPLGATWDGRGVNFALFSEHAVAVELCLFDAQGRETRVNLPWRTAYVWHVYVPGLGPGQRYGWRVHGPFAPEEGHRFNPNKLLLDPYARALDGQVDLRGSVYGYARDAGAGPQKLDDRDDAQSTVKGVVVDDAFDWGDDRPPRVPWHAAVFYELHVKGFTRRHPGIPEELRGTYLGLASEPAIRHLQSLGVTTVDLMPVHEHLDEPTVAARGMTNYWGYSTLAYFAPDRRFATRGGDAVRELKQMVRMLHAAGIEVVLDVVYNHSCEVDALGPTVSLRGIDNRVYYRLQDAPPRAYLDYTGCGNTLDATHPQVLKLITDSLRYWVTEMHVDGFRFDLAAALARGTDGDVDRISAFFAVVHQDPVLSRTKLIAEPWDVGRGGYQIGNFPILWTEWNGRFRDTVRAFWRGERRAVADLGYRLTGSSDLFADDGRHPHASINMVTAHDGFTLRDLVSYEKKHNEANGEGNRDGWDDSGSQNCGVEGETDDPLVLARRRTLARSILSTLFLSQGVPMLSMGDELWRTQRGNNNPYCQDSELTWVDWSPSPGASSMLDHVRSLAALRRRHPVFSRHDFLRGVSAETGRPKDITWLRVDGSEMTDPDWSSPARAAMAFRLDGGAVDIPLAPAAVRDDSFLVLMNGERSALTFTLPPARLGQSWRVVVDASEPPRLGEVRAAGGPIELAAGGLVVLVEVSPGLP
jgi:isoamylase